MIEATALWTDDERFVGTATSGHATVMDAAKDKTASSPMELVLIALCGCTASDVVGILRKKREPFTGLEVLAQGERAAGYPAVYSEIKLTYRVRGQVSQKAMEDAVRLSKEKYCSVSAMLEKTAKISYTIEHVA
ncbi:MAG: OsmC family protein [Acidobacteriales bacterium]|nr:OsmC family protein [Candidatus Koribacter versatilis]MBI3647132.1 OsmC family protein [Terriglobales bacterium]